MDSTTRCATGNAWSARSTGCGTSTTAPFWRSHTAIRTPRNTYQLDDGAIRFLDWQTTCLAPWADDVAYFLVEILGIEDRRAHEKDLLRHYLSALSAAAGARLDFDEAWLASRRHHLHGLMFALCPPQMQPPEVCTVMGDRYAAAAREHETLRALEQ